MKIATNEDLCALSIRIRDHLVKQKAVSNGRNGSCMYRNNAGHMCAVGSIIDPELYDPEIEGFTARCVEMKPILEKSLGFKIEKGTAPGVLDILGGWQRYHDSDAPLGYRVWIESFDPDIKPYSKARPVSPDDFHQQMMEKIQEYA